LVGGASGAAAAAASLLALAARNENWRIGRFHHDDFEKRGSRSIVVVAVVGLVVKTERDRGHVLLLQHVVVVDSLGKLAAAAPRAQLRNIHFCVFVLVKASEQRVAEKSIDMPSASRIRRMMMSPEEETLPRFLIPLTHQL